MATKIADYFVAIGAKDYGLSSTIDQLEKSMEASAGRAEELMNQSAALYDFADAMEQVEKDASNLRTNIIKTFVSLSASVTGALVVFTKWETKMAKARVEARLFGKTLKGTAEEVEAMKEGMLQEELAGTFTGALRVLTEHVYALTAAFGECIANGLAPLIPLLEQGVLWLTGLDESTKQWIAGITLATIALTGFVTIFPTLESGITAVWTALNLLATPLGLIVLGIGAITAALIECYGTGDTFGEKLGNVFSGLVEWVEAAIDVVRNFDLVWELIALNFQEKVTHMREHIMNFVVRVIDYISWLGEAVADFITGNGLEGFSKAIPDSSDPLTDFSKWRNSIEDRWAKRSEDRFKKQKDNADKVRDKFTPKVPPEFGPNKEAKAKASAAAVKPEFFQAADLFKRNIMEAFKQEEEAKKQTELQKEILKKALEKIEMEKAQHKELVGAIGKVNAVGPQIMALDLNAVLEEVDDSGGFVADAENTKATRLAVCAADKVLEVTQMLSGYAVKIGDSVIRVGAHPHPFLPGLRVKTVEALPIGKKTSDSWLAGGTAEKYRLTVGYEIPQYDDEENEPPQTPQDEDQPEPSELYLTQSLDYSVEILTVPVKASSYVYPGMWADVIVKKPFRIPTVTYTATYERTPKPPWQLIIDTVGKINTVKIFGGPPGTVLFDGATANRTSGRGPDFTKAARFWKLSLKFIYHPHGWNKILHPQSLEWVDAKSMDGAELFGYEEANLKELFTG